MNAEGLMAFGSFYPKYLLFNGLPYTVVII